MNEPLPRVAIADDHPLVVTALRDCLQRSGRFQIGCACSGGSELVLALDRQPADIAITDFCMGHGNATLDGFNLLNRLARRHRGTRIVVVSAQSNAAIIRRAFKLGARAFVSKEDELEETLRACLHVMASDSSYHSPSIRALLDNAAIAEAPATDLTPRELEVIRLYAQGMQLNEIAAKLGRSVSTISSQKTVAMRKLSVHTNTDLIRYAYENGLI
jgi:two-component system capsular synthesis response regulator RcsB